MNKIGNFLGKAPNPELSAGITELCTFDRMKKEKNDNIDGKKDHKFWKSDFSFYRKGKILNINIKKILNINIKKILNINDIKNMSTDIDEDC